MTEQYVEVTYKRSLTVILKWSCPWKNWDIIWIR